MRRWQRSKQSWLEECEVWGGWFLRDVLFWKEEGRLAAWSLKESRCEEKTRNHHWVCTKGKWAENFEDSGRAYLGNQPDMAVADRWFNWILHLMPNKSWRRAAVKPGFCFSVCNRGLTATVLRAKVLSVLHRFFSSILIFSPCDYLTLSSPGSKGQRNIHIHEQSQLVA